MNPTDPTPLPCPTPRTDAAEVVFAANWRNSYGNSISAVYADFARQLETELAQAQAKLADAAKELMQCAAQAGLTEVPRDEPCHVAIGRAFQQAQAEAAAMREALCMMVDEYGVEHDQGCLEDDTCDCIFPGEINAALATTAGAELLERLRTLERINKRACEDWADEDTAIKAECRAFGIDTEGDSYGVPTMVDCVKQLAERLRKAEALAKHFLPTTTENTKPQ